MHKLYNVKLVASHDLELSQWKSAWVASRICLCWLTDYVYRLLITYVIRLIRYVTTLGRLVDTIKRNRLKWMWGDLSRLDSMEITHYTHTEFSKTEWTYIQGRIYKCRLCRRKACVWLGPFDCYSVRSAPFTSQQFTTKPHQVKPLHNSI